MSEIDPELLKRLDALGVKLGTTAEEAWKILAAQAYAEALSLVPWLILWVVAAYIGSHYAMRVWGERKENNEEWMVPLMLCTAIAILGSLGLIDCISQLCSILYSPQGWALRKLLNF